MINLLKTLKKYERRCLLENRKINHIFTFHVTHCIVTLLAFALIASIRVLLSVGAWRLLLIHLKFFFKPLVPGETIFQIPYLISCLIYVLFDPQMYLIQLLHFHGAAK